MRVYHSVPIGRPVKINARSIPPKGGSGVPRLADIDQNVNAEDYLARTVYEDRELIDIGVMDANGNPIMAMERMEPIGFVHHKPKS